MVLEANVLFMMFSKPDNGPPGESSHYSIRPQQYSRSDAAPAARFVRVDGMLTAASQLGRHSTSPE